MILVKILAPGFYARQIMRTPVKIAFVTVLITQTLAVLFAWGIGGFEGLGPSGLTLATSVGACVNAGLLFWLLRKYGYYVPQPGWLRFFAKVVVALIVLGTLLFWLAGAPTFWLTAGLWAKVTRLAAVVGAGIVVYFATLYVLGFRFADFNRRESGSTLS